MRRLQTRLWRGGNDRHSDSGLPRLPPKGWRNRAGSQVSGFRGRPQLDAGALWRPRKALGSIAIPTASTRTIALAAGLATRPGGIAAEGNVNRRRRAVVHSGATRGDVRAGGRRLQTRGGRTSGSLVRSVPFFQAADGNQTEHYRGSGLVRGNVPENRVVRLTQGGCRRVQDTGRISDGDDGRHLCSLPRHSATPRASGEQPWTGTGFTKVELCK